MCEKNGAHALQRFVEWGFLILTFCGCASTGPLAPDPIAVRIHALEDTVRLVRGTNSASLDFNAVVKDNDRRVLLVDGCMPPAQRQIDSVWRTVFWSECALGDYIRVNPGDSTILNIHERGYNVAGFEMTLSPLLGSGRYRLLVTIGYADKLGNLVSDSPATIGSEPLVVRDSTYP